jgi:hypothetical protein
VQRLAPDQASLSAASSLRKPGKWPLIARATERQLVWGECQGSGASPYRVSVTLDELSYKCTCPSRKFPCKHALALFWMVADNAALAEATAPGWVEEWVAGRKRTNRAAPTSTGPKDIGAAALPEVVDPEEEAKKAAEKRRKEREESVLAGLEELERWVGDVLGEGLAAFGPKATERCRRIAARLVDAKAPELAFRLDELPGALFARPEAARPEWLLGELGRIVLLIQAWRRRDQLPAPLQADLRRLIGWTTNRDELLADPDALRVTDAWTVLAVHEETQVNRLLRRETWLRRHGDGTPDFAVLVEHHPVTAIAEATYAPGEVIRGTLVFYPSAAPSRALLAVRDAVTTDAPEAALQGGHPGLDAAVKAGQLRVAAQPWLHPVPMLAEAHLGRVGSTFVLTSSDGAILPVVNGNDPALWALAGAGPSRVAFLHRDDGAQLLAAASPAGFWVAP